MQTTNSHQSVSNAAHCFVPDHPLIAHCLAIVRNKETPFPAFRNAMNELGRWLAYEAAKDFLPTVPHTINTPLAPCKAQVLCRKTPVCLVPILRAGLALIDGAQSITPEAHIYHLGLKRDEATLQPLLYLNALPQRFEPGSRIFVLEPMLATGGTMLEVLNLLLARGVAPSCVRILSVVASPQALQRLHDAHREVQIVAAAVDSGLNDHGYIVPGLGDAGDRAFGTL